MSYALDSSEQQAQPAAVDRYRLQVSLHSRKPRRCTIRAAGELDLAAADQLLAVLNQQCESGRCVTRLDLSAVTFLDCSCLGALVQAHHRFLATHGALRLTGIGPPVERLLTLTGLGQTLFTSFEQPPSQNTVHRRF